MTTKTCTLCGETKPEDEYYFKKDGTRKARCKECLRKRQRQLYQEAVDPEGMRTKTFNSHQASEFLRSVERRERPARVYDMIKRGQIERWQLAELLGWARNSRES